ncbi:hypothetical protein KAU08_10885 [bacterium]|nr:hypothetical protein [bacterium]
MNLNRKIPTIILYAILTAVVWAVWLVFSNLNPETPPPDDHELLDFRSTLLADTSNMIDNRESALLELELVPGMPDPVGFPGKILDTRTSLFFERARTAAGEALIGEIASTEYPSIAEGFPAWEVLDTTLDEADRIYFDWLAERSGTAMSICLNSLEGQSGSSILKTGYLRLIESLNRDLIKYRQKESLAVHDEKTTLYQTELDTINGNCDEARAIVRSLLSESNALVDSRYDARIEDLYNRFIDMWTGSEIGFWLPRGDSKVLDDIRSRLNRFLPVSMVTGPDIEPSNFPGSGRMAWLQGERILLQEFVELVWEN